eukprot:scaffold298_cov247-Pinguiococcus_pyrenoidosus.AAC.7
MTSASSESRSAFRPPGVSCTSRASPFMPTFQVTTVKQPTLLHFLSRLAPSLSVVSASPTVSSP